MTRSLRLILAASISLAGLNLAHGQDTPTTTPPDASVSGTTDVAKLKSENAALKKEVSDAAQTIAKLQAQLAQATQAAQAAQQQQQQHQAPEATTITDTTAPAATPAAAPPGPLKALPLDSTNAVANPAAPGSPATDAGPGRTYTVVKGDSLWKIAHKMYPGDTKNGVDKLQEANKDAIGGKPLKIGQVLVVPQ
jgi:nucleoid-associated protein YgaU